MTQQTDLYRILDANANRVMEGLRVSEEYARFVLDDAHLARLLKEMRHDLLDALSEVPADARFAARETRQDVGTTVSMAAEFERSTTQNVAITNLKRAEQAFRVLEEYGKLLSPRFAAAMESLRYRAYTLCRALAITASSLERLETARIYALVDGADSAAAFEQRIAALIAAGVDMMQLRDKRLDDRTLLARARQLRNQTRDTAVMFVVNDRPDIALLSQADGVHTGQDELSVKDCRTVLGPQSLVGVSTHTIEQARTAVLDGASYLGCGPTFPSETKSFSAYPGLPFLREVAAEIRLPSFAIGGIHAENIHRVADTGLRRVAVGSALSGNPANVEKTMKTIKAALSTPGKMHE